MAVQNRSGVSHSDSRTIANSVCISKMYYIVFKIPAIENCGITNILTSRTVYNSIARSIYYYHRSNARLSFCVSGMYTKG